MSIRRIFAFLLTALLVSFTLVLQASSASAQPSTDAPRPASKYCFSEVAPTSPGSRDLEIISTTCSEKAKPGTKLPDTMAAPAAYTLLVTLFESANYLGTYTTLGGQFGTCDAAGYGFSNLNYANAIVYGISSYILNGACQYSTIYTGINYGGSPRTYYNQGVAYVGPLHNDQVRSMRISA